MTDKDKELQDSLVEPLVNTFSRAIGEPVEKTQELFDAMKETAIETAAQITGKPAEEMTKEEAAGVLYDEIGKTVPHDDPAELAARRMIQKDIEKGSKKAWNLNKARTKQTAQDVQELTADEIIERMYGLAFSVDALKNPFDAALHYAEITGNDSFFYDFYKKYTLKAAEAIAKTTGADVEQVLDPERRTEEQQKYMLELSARVQLARMDKFFDTNYIQASMALFTIKGKYNDPEPEDDYSIKEYAVLYFFALHYPDIKPTDEKSLTEENIAELRDIFGRIDAFYYAHATEWQTDPEQKLFLEFIKEDSPEPARTLELLPRIMTMPPDSIEYPLDKINSNIWDDLMEAAKDDPNGQLRFALEKAGSKKEATAIYSINFDELEKLDGLKVTKSLTTFDKRVYIAVNAIYAQSGHIMSAGQVFAAMGNTGKPSTKQIKKINDSLTKMGAARIYLNNEQEISVNKGYKHFKYDASLLPFERISAYINNALVESAIHLFREPPLITFAKERNQITTITKMLLESPVNKTEANLRIDDYLIERIARMKSGKGKTSRKMLYSKIYDKCQIKTKMQRNRAPETIRRYLEHYKKCEWIHDYKEDPDGVTIIFKPIKK